MPMICTVQLLVNCETETEASDAVAANLQNLEHVGVLVDWAYYHKETLLTPANAEGYCYPFPVVLPEGYQEGDAFGPKPFWKE